jgi:hypothetical protein
MATELHPLPASASPPVRTGLAGVWDRVVGPGATRAENALIVIASLLGGLGVAASLAAEKRSMGVIVAAALIGFDVVGGAVANATTTTKRWYHRPGSSEVHHLGFVSLHLVHVALVAVLFRGGDLAYFAAVSGYLVAASAVVALTPVELKRPAAAALFAVALLGWTYLLGPTPGLGWFVPLLFMKLLVGHMVPSL